MSSSSSFKHLQICFAIAVVVRIAYLFPLTLSTLVSEPSEGTAPHNHMGFAYNRLLPF